ncbi:MAG: (d)CMP kinase [Capnocytophaga sp.]|nr:(d)CMP kinase [Capnocytophaga sp.]
MKKIIIAIDGFSSTGKSTIAKLVAKELGYAYIDTGAMFRAVTYLAIKNHFIEKQDIDNQDIKINEDLLLEKLKTTSLEFRFDNQLGFAPIFLDGINVEKEIRSIEVAQRVSQIAKIAKIRSYLADIQQKMGKNKGIVMDGRDIGTIIFPNAELKIFMTASEQIRAERRYKELIEKGENISLEEVLANIRERDYTDTHRTEAPLKKAKDAIEIDNSHTTIEEVVHKIIYLAKERS